MYILYYLTYVPSPLQYSQFSFAEYDSNGAGLFQAVNKWGLSSVE